MHDIKRYIWWVGILAITISFSERSNGQTVTIVEPTGRGMNWEVGKTYKISFITENCIDEHTPNCHVLLKFGPFESPFGSMGFDHDGLHEFFWTISESNYSLVEGYICSILIEIYSSSNYTPGAPLAWDGISGVFYIVHATTNSMSVSMTDWTAPSGGGISSTVTVANSGTGGAIGYTISSNAGWLTTSASNGTTPGSFTMIATANSSGSDRTATVTVTATTPSGTNGSPRAIRVNQARQNPSSGIHVSGTVTDTYSLPVSGVRVELTDEYASSGNYSTTTDGSGRYWITLSLSNVTDDQSASPGTYELLQNYPNPFNPATTIQFRAPGQGHIKLIVYNVLGRKIRTLLEGDQARLTDEVVWDGTDDEKNGVPAGIYLYSLTAGNVTQTRKMLLLDGNTAGPMGRHPVEPGVSDNLRKACSSYYHLQVEGTGIQTYGQSFVKITGDTIIDIIVTRSSGNVENMVLIPAGTFKMGNNGGADDERPEHTVYLNAFYIDKYEVTNVQYKQFCDATGRGYPGDPIFGYLANYPNYPVLNVSYQDAIDYAQWRGKRLPTEAEWEKAARGGLSGGKYPWGNEEPASVKCNYIDCSGLPGVIKLSFWNEHGPMPVGSFPPNNYGLFEMAGNVYEWCNDFYDPAYYANSPADNPHGPQYGQMHILRGGSWFNYAPALECSDRGKALPNGRDYDNGVGFRCAMSQ